MYSTKQAWFNEEGSAGTVLSHGLFGWWWVSPRLNMVISWVNGELCNQGLGQKLDFADQKSARLCVPVQIESSLFNTLKTLAYFSTLASLHSPWFSIPTMLRRTRRTMICHFFPSWLVTSVWENNSMFAMCHIERKPWFYWLSLLVISPSFKLENPTEKSRCWIPAFPNV